MLRGGVLSLGGHTAQHAELGVVTSNEANTPKRNRVIKQFTDLFGVTITPTNATVTSIIDPDSPFGCPALKLSITFSTTGGRVEITPPPTNIPSFNGHVAYTVWVDDATKIGSYAVFLGTTGFAAYRQVQTSVFSGGDLVAGQRVWYAGPICKNGVTDGGFVFGSNSLQTTKLRINSANPNQSTVVWIKDCFIPEPQRPIICFTWDDGYNTWVTKVKPILDANGVKATFGVNTANIDIGAGITTANLNTLISDGHQIASHNVNNYRLQTLYGNGNGEANGTSTSQSISAYVGDYNTARAALEAFGVDQQYFMYHPWVQGGSDEGGAEALQAAGVDIARTTSPYEAQLYGFDVGNNSLNLRAVELGSSRTLSSAQAMVDDAVTYGGVVIFMGHETNDSVGDSVTWLTSNVSALVAYAASKDADILTIFQLRDHLIGRGCLKPRGYYNNPMPMRCIGRVNNANMNSTADQAITLDSGQWKIEAIYLTDASTSMTTAAGGFYTAAAKGGTAIVAAAQTYTGLTAATSVVAPTMAATPTVSSGTIYFSLTTAQGSTATADIFVFGRPVTS